MKNRAPQLIASAFLVVTLATACGGGGRPSVDDLSDAIQDQGGEVTDEQSECVAKAYHDSDLSDDALQAFVDDDEDYKPSDKDTKAIAEVTSESAKCATS